MPGRTLAMLPGILDTMAPDGTEGTDAAASMTVSHGTEPARSRRWPAALAWVLAGLAVLSAVPSIRLMSLVWFVGSPEAAPTIAAVGPVILAVVSAVTVGALVASRRPRHPVGWLLLGVGPAVAVNVLVDPYVKYGLLVRPGSVPAARHLVDLLRADGDTALAERHDERVGRFEMAHRLPVVAPFRAGAAVDPLADGARAARRREEIEIDEMSHQVPADEPRVVRQAVRPFGTRRTKQESRREQRASAEDEQACAQRDGFPAPQALCGLNPAPGCAKLQDFAFVQEDGSVAP